MLAGVVPTTLISHFTKEFGSAGIMITASHNPYKDNGIKVFYKGNKLSLEQELGIEDFIDGNREFSVVKVGDLINGDQVVDLYADLIDSL